MQQNADQPGVEPTALDDSHRPGMPEGLTVEGREERSRLAAALTRAAFPGDREHLLEVATAMTPQDDHVLSQLRSLPAGTTFQKVQDVADALGLGHEVREAGGSAPVEPDETGTTGTAGSDAAG